MNEVEKPDRTKLLKYQWFGLAHDGDRFDRPLITIRIRYDPDTPDAIYLGEQLIVATREMFRTLKEVERDR